MSGLSAMAIVLSAPQLAEWTASGWLLVRGAIEPSVIDELRGWIDEVESWAAGGGPGLHHWEQTDAGPALARSEDLVPYHEGLRRFVCTGAIRDWAAAVLGEPAVLFKEKVNYKKPGGAGFAPHQDATAYRFADHHVSCMVPVDPATVESGSLEVAAGHRLGHLPTDAGGRIEEATAAKLAWQPVELAPGDILWFDSYTPHRSGTNTTTRARRALYLTYNAAAYGDLRDTYYADKAAELEASDGTFGGERVRISISDDFLGRPVEPTR